MFWPIRHRRLRHSLSAYIDGQLSAAEAEALEQHLAACDACRRELEELRATVLALRDLPEEAIPRSFALTPGQVARPTPPRPVPASPVLATGMRLAGAALAFALAAVLVVDLGDLGGDSGGPMGVSEAPAEMAAPDEISAPEPMEGAEKEADRAAAPDRAEEEGVETYGEVTPLTGAAELQEAAKPGGGLDPLQAAEVAIGAALGFLVVGNLTLAFAKRKR